LLGFRGLDAHYSPVWPKVRIPGGRFVEKARWHAEKSCVRPFLRHADPTKRPMAYSAAAMFGGAAFLGLVEGLIPGGEDFSLLPGLGALAFVVILLLVGPRLPIGALAALGPIGAALIAVSLATTHGHGDGAVLYMWPVLWVSYFFGRRGAFLIVAWIGIVHALALSSMANQATSLDRWLDVMVSVGLVAAVVETLSERNRRLLSRLAIEARVDKLTNVFNRRGFEERALIELDRARREASSVAVASFDIDRFKRVNDEWGHEAGDEVLSRLGALLREQTRRPDIVARLGGEEFVALLPGSDVEKARAYAERVRASFSDVEDLGFEFPRLTLSAGVSAAIAPDDLEALLHAADAAMYAAKRAGRDRTAVDPKLGPPAVDVEADSAILVR
jgi:diguanylate cyclase (GGDEF)-like protein